MIARTITAVWREDGASQDATLEDRNIVEAIGALEPVRDENIDDLRERKKETLRMAA